MRLFLAAGLLLLGARGTTDSPPAEAPFAFGLPKDVGEVGGFEVVTGEFTNDRATGSYVFYVNPRFRSVYQVMRYRVSFTADGPLVATEKVVWIQRPGERVPLVVWERLPAGDAGGWRSMTTGTREYQIEMGRVMYVLSAHQTARRQGLAVP